MMRLFSPFDLIFFYFRNFILSFTFFFMTIIVFLKNSSLIFINSISTKLEEFFYTLKNKNFNKIRSLISLVLIFNILLLNIFSVFPFNFPLASQFRVVFFSSLTIWFRFIIFNVFSNIKGLISHIIPEGTPIYLTMLLFLIEIVRNFIRPITLTVRLVANILAGHLLIILLSKIVILAPIAFIFYIVLNIVELFVSVIQAYIFTTMVILYFSEVH